MKKIIFVLTSLLLCSSVFAQMESEDDSFGFDEEALFGSEDDEFFFDDGIEELVVETDARSSEISHGALFENGSIKIGGSFNTSLNTSTRIWSEKNDDFAENLKNTVLIPTASALISLDARPTQVLRMYTKFGFAYPYSSTAVSTATTEERPLFGQKYYVTNVSTAISDYIKVKEMFTDFSAADRAFFRFGLHTVTWGTGLFFSPVSDMVNSSSIDPENTDLQVDGCFNLRTQITFPGSQNCLWLYVIPDKNLSLGNQVNLIDTAFAGKGDLVIGGWEFGLGTYYKYQNAPKVMITASGSLKKMTLFSECVYTYGAASEWAYEPDSWENKTSIFQGTIGLSYFWKEPKITLAAQYYYDGYKSSKELNLFEITKFVGDMKDLYFTKGHNFAMVVNFGKVFGTSDLNATIFAMGNYGKDDIPETIAKYIPADGLSESYMSSITVSGLLNYTPVKSFTVGAGPYVTFKDWESKPDVSLKVNLTFGGGKF